MSTWSILLCIAMVGVRGPAIPFDLDHPARVYKLPTELREVSALTDVDSHTVACLHDEAARLYHFDLRTGRVVATFPFDRPGDLEGLTRVGEEYFALRSDGLLYRLGLKSAGLVVRDTVRLTLPQGNLEGLGFDPVARILLVSPKGVLKGSPTSRDVRLVHGYDPMKERLIAEPVLRLSVEDLAAQARKAGFELPMRTTDKGRHVPALKLRLSSIAVDPHTGLYYLLSAVDRVLLVLDRSGELVHLHVLNERLSPKPEGITFLPDGDMLISTEGVDRAPAILRFARLTD